jgi:hypothetical protein
MGDLRDDGLARLLNGENEGARGQFDVTLAARHKRY